MSSLFFFDLIFLLPLFIIGGVCFYTDIKYGKIFNKWIKIGLLWGVFFYILLFFYNSFFLFQASNTQYLIDVTINVLIAFFVGYFIWRFGLWSAGDAKFFALCSLLLPLKFYSKSYLSYFPSFNLLVNLFVPILVALTISALLSGIEEVYKKRHELKIKKLLNIKKLFSSFKIFAPKVFSMILSYIFIFILFKGLDFFKKNVPEVGSLFNPLTLFLLIFVFYSFISKIEPKIKWIRYVINGASVIYCSFLLFSGKIEIFTLILRQALILMVLVTFFRQTLNFYIEKKEVIKIKIDELKRGNVLSHYDTSIILKYLKGKEKEKDFGKIRAEGLNEKQVQIIKDLFVEKHYSKISIYKTFPFAPFMLLSVIISILTRSSIIASLMLKL